MGIVSITVVQKWQEGENLEITSGKLGIVAVLLSTVRMGQGKNENKFLATGLLSR